MTPRWVLPAQFRRLVMRRLNPRNLAHTTFGCLLRKCPIPTKWILTHPLRAETSTVHSKKTPDIGMRRLADGSIEIYLLGIHQCCILTTIWISTHQRHPLQAETSTALSKKTPDIGMRRLADGSIGIYLLGIHRCCIPTTIRMSIHQRHSPQGKKSTVYRTKARDIETKPLANGRPE